MLYLSNGKIYVRPFVNKMVEVDIKKNLNGEFDVIPTKNIVQNDNLNDLIKSISLEEAYEIIQNKRKRID